MRAWAKQNNLPLNHALYTYADELEKTAKSYFGDGSCDAKKFVGVYARAKSVYCYHSGEELITGMSKVAETGGKLFDVLKQLQKKETK